MDYQTRLNNATNELTGVYKPQEDFYNKQLGELPAFYDQQRTQADMARVNAFRGIERTANSRGMFFSGQPIESQMNYNFGTYNPALARISLDQNNKKSSLEQALITLTMQKQNQARSMVDAQIAAEAKAAKEAQDRADAERRHQERLRASYARSAPDPGKGYGLKQKEGNAGYMFYGPNGRPVSMAQYAQATGTSMIDLLRNSNSKYDKNALNYLQFYQASKPRSSEADQINYLRKNFSLLF